MQQGGNIPRVIASVLRPAYLFVLYFAVTLLLYRQTIGARIVTDALNWLITYETQGAIGIFNSFGDVSQHYSYHLLFYFLYAVFGTNEVGYYIVFSMLHAANAALLFVLLKDYLQLFAVKQFMFISTVASLLFLFNPYQTEAVVWGATVHYLSLTFLFLWIWKVEISKNGMHNSKGKRVGWLLFFFAIYLHLIAVTIPVILLFILLPVYNFRLPKTLFAIAPYFVILIFYFITNYISLGSWSGHTAGYTQTSVSIVTLLANINRFAAKDFFLVHFLPYNLRDTIYAFAQSTFAITALCILLASFFYLYLYKAKRKNNLWLLSLSVLAFCIALIPSATLYFYYLTPIESDRLTYFALLFSSVFFGAALSGLPQRMALLLATVFIVVNGALLFVSISAWNDAAKVATSLETTFPHTQNGTVYLLNVPDNIRGAYLYREGKNESKFVQSIQFKHNQLSIKANEVMQFNMQKITDGVEVEIIDDNTLKIKFAQYGNWWWMEGKGAINYSDDNKEVLIADSGMAYTVHFKNRMPNDTFVYLNNNQWHILDNF